MRGEEEQTLAFFDTGILALSIPPFWVWIWLCGCVVLLSWETVEGEERQKFYRKVRR